VASRAECRASSGLTSHGIQQAWDATPKTDPPRPNSRWHHAGSDEIRATRIRDNGTVQVGLTLFQVSCSLTGSTAYLVEEPESLMAFDDQGTLIIEHPWPEPGTKYVGSRRPRGRRRKNF
jgi:hypothetical protein